MNIKDYEEIAGKLISLVKRDAKEAQKLFVKKFDEFLDELADDDFFGTEKQNDPRGDGREKK